MDKEQKKVIALEQSKEDSNKLIEALKKENEALKAKVASTPQDLESRIQFFKMQEQNLKRLDKITEVLRTLEEIRAFMQNDSDELEGEKYSISIQAPTQGYGSRADSILKISNPKTVAHLVEVIFQQMKQREDELKEALIA